MEVEEIERRMRVGREEACGTDVSEVACFPGYVRTIRFREETIVDVDYAQ